MGTGPSDDSSVEVVSTESVDGSLGSTERFVQADGHPELQLQVLENEDALVQRQYRLQLEQLRNQHAANIKEHERSVESSNNSFMLQKKKQNHLFVISLVLYSTIVMGVWMLTSEQSEIREAGKWLVGLMAGHLFTKRSQDARPSEDGPSST